MGMFINMFYI